MQKEHGQVTGKPWHDGFSGCQTTTDAESAPSCQLIDRHDLIFLAKGLAELKKCDYYNSHIKI